MDEDMEELVGEFFEPSEVDLDYEFDAYQFYDFVNGESNSEAGETESWFETAGSYPPSPLIMKYLRKGISSSSNDDKSMKSTSKKHNATARSDVSQSTKGCKEENVKAKKKSVLKPSKQRSSTLMKPTASHLAKLNSASHAHSSHLCRRGERRVQSPYGSDNAATKRQKLEIGYLQKDAQLKHQNLPVHKIITKGGRGSSNMANFKTKVTIPKEPELETQQRAQNRRNAETSEYAEPRTGNLKARPLNKQMLHAPSLTPPKKSTRQLPEFKVFHLKTMERAMHHSSLNDLSIQNSDSASHCGAADLKRSKTPSHKGFKMKCEMPLKIRPRSLNNSKIFPTKEDIDMTKDINEAKISVEFKLSKNERLSQNPPTELFNKLSLISELEETVSQPKGHLPKKVSKENAPDSFQPEFLKYVGKPNQCGSNRGIPGIANQPNMNRSLGIR